MALCRRFVAFCCVEDLDVWRAEVEEMEEEEREEREREEWEERVGVRMEGLQEIGNVQHIARDVAV